MARRVRRTVFIVCEGKTDLGFLKHLRRTYCSGRADAPEMAFKQSYGKGGNHVVDVLLREVKYKAYDVPVALTEGDAPPSQTNLKALGRIKGRHVVVSPCIEGLLLEILGHPVPTLSSVCKDRLAAIEACDLSDPLTYERHWARGRLDGARPAILVLDQLIGLFE